MVLDSVSNGGVFFYSSNNIMVPAITIKSKPHTKNISANLQNNLWLLSRMELYAKKADIRKIKVAPHKHSSICDKARLSEIWNSETTVRHTPIIANDPLNTLLFTSEKLELESVFCSIGLND